MDVAMKVEWPKWTEFGPCKKLPPREVKERALEAQSWHALRGRTLGAHQQRAQPHEGPPRRSRMSGGQIADPHGRSDRI
eukprot:5012401-Pyramimonas_sp.AAC.1